MVKFDLVIVGGGPGGYKCAAEAGRLGLKTALIEKRATLGGTCLNEGCIPTKALLDCSHKFQMVSHLAYAGIIANSTSFDYDKILSFKDSVVDINTKGINQLMKSNEVTVFTGTGNFIDSNHIQITGEESAVLEFDKCVIATGSKSTTLPFIESTHDRVIDSTDALSITPPQSLIVLGAGAIGLEFATHFSRLGTVVTIIEYEKTLAPMMDFEVGKTLERSFKKAKVKLSLGTQVQSIEYGENSITATGLDKKGNPISITADYILSATGRSPFTTGLGLENIPLEVNEWNQIKVSPNFETDHKHIYAIGDVIPGPMLAHKAEYEGILVAQHISGKTIDTKVPSIPGVIYTQPEAASIGATEQELTKNNTLFKKGVAQFRSNGRARAVNEIEGFVKILAHEDGTIAGIHIVGSVASELIAEAGIIMKTNMTLTDIAHTVHAHPTFSETLKEAAEICLHSN